MAFEIIARPHCCNRIAPMTDGTCPACRKNTHEAPESVSASNSGGRQAAWDRYQESLLPTAGEQATDLLRRVEQGFTELRVGAVARLKANAGADRAMSDRIREELLPRLAAVLDKGRQAREPDNAEGHDTSALAECVKTRKESWELLAEALRENNAEKLERHIELWVKSEMLGVAVMAAKPSLTTPTPAQRVSEFKRAPVTFTPRLIATPTIVIANVLIFAAMIAMGIDAFAPTPRSLVEWGANFGPKTMNGQWWRLVTCMFLHCGIFHLGFNMWVLWDLGRLVERLVGNVGFVVLYFVSGIAGSVASLAWNPVVVSVGASAPCSVSAALCWGSSHFTTIRSPLPVPDFSRSRMLTCSPNLCPCGM
jgi:membrane associated rhomboid family serine protease